MAKRVVDVLVPVALDRAYSYRVPDGMALKPGDVVSVPLGAREATAVVWAENANPDPRLHNRLKDVGEKLDVPPLKPELRSLVDWVANYTLSARGMVLPERCAARHGSVDWQCCRSVYGWLAHGDACVSRNVHFALGLSAGVCGMRDAVPLPEQNLPTVSPSRLVAARLPVWP